MLRKILSQLLTFIYEQKTTKEFHIFLFFFLNKSIFIIKLFFFEKLLW